MCLNVLSGSSPRIATGFSPLMPSFCKPGWPTGHSFRRQTKVVLVKVCFESSISFMNNRLFVYTPFMSLHKYRTVYETNRLFRKPPLLGPPLSLPDHCFSADSIHGDTQVTLSKTTKTQKKGRAPEGALRSPSAHDMIECQ